MRVIFFMLVTFIGLILHGGNITNYIALGQYNIKPDFMIILMVYFSLRTSATAAIISAFILGFGSDLVLLPMGPFMITYVLAAVAVSYFRQTPVAVSTIAQSFLTFIVTALILAGANLLKFLANKEMATDLTIRIFSTALYSALISPFVIVLLDWFAIYFGYKKQK